MEIWFHTLNKKETLNNTGEMEKNTGKVEEICQSEKVGTMALLSVV